MHFQVDRINQWKGASKHSEITIRIQCCFNYSQSPSRSLESNGKSYCYFSKESSSSPEASYFIFRERPRIWLQVCSIVSCIVIMNMDCLIWTSQINH